MKYLGFATTKLNKRRAGHRANIINKTEGKIILKHFTRYHNITDMVIQPIEICDKSILRAREQFWQQELNTIYPYGLNNRIDLRGIKDAHDHIKYNYETAIYTLFNEVKNNRTKKGSGNGRQTSTMQDEEDFDADAFITNFTNIMDVENIHKRCRASIMELKMKHLKLLFLFINMHLDSYNFFPYNEHLLSVMMDICLYRLTKSHKQHKKVNTYIILEFLHKSMDKLKLKKLLLSNPSLERFPISKENIQQVGISYKYIKTIRNIVTNYNDTIKYPDWMLECKCHGI